MGVDDYLASLVVEHAEDAALERIPDALWDAKLSGIMREKRLAAYEESLLPVLLEDLRQGSPGRNGGATEVAALSDAVRPEGVPVSRMPP